MRLIRRADSEADLAAIRTLFREYWNSLGVRVCFQDLQAELDALPGEYAPPQGELLLADEDGEAAGCVALRRLADDICELKRLYVREDFRRHGIGRALVHGVLQFARESGYKLVRLDSLPSMKFAQLIYESLGFYDIPAYYKSVIAGKRNMELQLDKCELGLG